MFKAVIFDFDGVIVDSEKWHCQSFNDTLAGFDLNLSWQEYCDIYLGYTDAEVFEKISSENQLALDSAQVNELVDKKAVIFDNLARKSTEVIDGVKEFLVLLSENNIPLAICSGASNADIDAMLDGTDVENYFSIIVSADDVEKGKPDPTGYLLTLEKMNAKFNTNIVPAECVVIEDSHWGIEAGIAAGMNVIGVASSYSTEELVFAKKAVANLKDITMKDLQSLCD